MKVPPFGKVAESPRPDDEPDTTVEAPPRQTSAPPPECPTEQEPNNDAAQATAFTKCVTGELTAWTDNDYLTITAPDDVEKMIVDHIEPDGAIQYKVTLADSSSGSFNMSFTDKAPETKIRPGQAYLFSLKWDNNGQGQVSDTRSYALRVTFE